jgi:hypothetical protein
MMSVGGNFASMAGVRSSPPFDFSVLTGQQKL